MAWACVRGRGSDGGEGMLVCVGTVRNRRFESLTGVSFLSFCFPFTHNTVLAFIHAFSRVQALVLQFY